MTIETFKKLGDENISVTDQTSHGYHRFFPRYVDQYQNSDDGILIIGIQNVKSLKLWLDYFPNIYIYGIDIGVEDKGDRYNIFKCDQSNKKQLAETINKINHKINIVIDDGSHIPEHQILSFDMLFKKLEDGGVYIIEDIETSYWKRGYIYSYSTNYGYKNKNSVIEIFKHLVDDVNNYYLNETDRQEQDKLLSLYFSKETRNMIKSVSFCQNCIILTKKCKDDAKYSDGIYAWNMFT